MTFLLESLAACALFTLLVYLIVIKGTEDMVKDYHDYWFHIKGGLIGMVLPIPAVLIAGVIVIL
ncbi:MAG: hypothetical protein IJ229_10135 [Clostridia bacterium]|nr:hypothetical protein [Clostridia bacterium]MBR1576784.1 hypothetical protein [Bacteroidales bacterium]MBR1576927.1 hypothetical protein [Bacteroidales bacterium]